MKKLLNWALIQITAYYGWSRMKNTVINVSVFGGAAVSNSFCDWEYTRLYQNTCSSLSSTCCIEQEKGVFIFDDVHGKELLHGQWGRLSKFLKGTHQITNKVFEYCETKDNQIQINNRYDKEQLIELSGRVREYESIHINAPDVESQAFSNHSPIPKSDTPGVIGDRVKHYNHFSTVPRYLTNMFNVFNHPNKYFDQCPNHMNIEHVLKMRELCHRYWHS